jgi:predicted nuclease of restriction endonuclease-like RecB superfamily
VHKQGVHPQLLEPDSPELLAFAESLLALFAETNGQTRTSLQERVNHAIAEFPDNVTIARGLEKLLLDRTKFEPAGRSWPADFRSTRKSIGEKSP